MKAAYHLVVQNDFDRRDIVVDEQLDLLGSEDQSEKESGELDHELDMPSASLAGARARLVDSVVLDGCTQSIRSLRNFSAAEVRVYGIGAEGRRIGGTRKTTTSRELSERSR